jgi:uncharacterized membrane protein YgaE (UPF0421/DUF939 family)
VSIANRITTSSRGPLLQAVKASLAAIVAWLVCEVLFTEPPIFAAIAALLVVQPSVNQSVAKGVERSIGVIAGVALAVTVGNFFGTSSWVVLATIVVSLVLAWVVKLSPGSATQVPISAMLVLTIGGLTPGYAFERVVETIIGALTALAVNLVIAPPVLLAPAHLAVARLLREVASRLDALAESLSTPQSPQQLTELLVRARELRPMRDAAQDALAKGTESLTFNPRGGRHKRVLERDEQLFARLSILVTRVIGMSRTLHDNYDPSLVGEPIVVAIATEVRRAAHDLRLVGRTTEAVEPEPVTDDIPALTAPLSIIEPDPEHWILIGSLLEDVRRVREEVIGSIDS